jgi:hypothetical protein
MSMIASLALLMPDLAPSVSSISATVGSLLVLTEMFATNATTVKLSMRDSSLAVHALSVSAAVVCLTVNLYPFADVTPVTLSMKSTSYATSAQTTLTTILLLVFVSPAQVAPLNAISTTVS